MTIKTYAHIENNVIVNVETGDDTTWAPHVSGYTLTDLTTLPTGAGIGWVKKGTQWVAPVTVVASPTTIPGDGVTMSTITYTDNRATPAATVTATVVTAAGTTTQTVTLSNGVGSLTVKSSTHGDLIMVTFTPVTVATWKPVSSSAAVPVTIQPGVNVPTT